MPQGNPMKRLVVGTILAVLAALPTNADEAPQAQGTAQVSVGDETASWPVWRCARIVLAHELPDADIRQDPHLKLIDYGDVIQMVLRLGDTSYLADIPAEQSIHNVDYTGQANATRVSNDSITPAGVATVTVRLQCNP